MLSGREMVRRPFFSDLQVARLAGADRAVDSEGSIYLVEILPPKAADFPPAQAGGQFCEEEVPPHLVLLNSDHESVQLFLIQNLLWTVVGLGDYCALGGILGD